MLNLNKYENTIIKLINIHNNSEIYGYLKSQYEDGYIVINKPIILINKYYVDPLSSFNSIIKYKYNDKDGTNITIPLSTVYNNDSTNDNIIEININNFIFIPLYDNSYLSEKKLDKDEKILHIKSIFEDYIEYIYTAYGDMVFNVGEQLSDLKK